MNLLSTFLPMPARTWLPLGLALLAPLMLLAMSAAVSRHRARGIATVLTLRTVVVLGVGFALLASVATFGVVRAGIRELSQRHEPAVRTLARDLERMPLGLSGANAQLRLTLFQAKDPSVGFVAVGGDKCGSDCLVATDDRTPGLSTLRPMLARTWSTSPGSGRVVSIGDRTFMLVAESAHGVINTPNAMVLVAIDAENLAQQATWTAWVLLGISYFLLGLVGWSSWKQVHTSLATRIHTITTQIRAGSVGEETEALRFEGAELRELSDSVSSYIQTTLERQKSSDERYRRVVELSPDGVFMCADAVIKFANAAALSLSGARSRYDVIGVPIDEFLEFDEGKAPLRGNALRPARWKRIDGTILHVEVSEIAETLRGGGVRQYVVRDVTDRRQREVALAHRAEHDWLTGLVNRARFETRLEEFLMPRSAAANAVPRQIAVLYIDLDGFKPVNDKHGHAAGDAVLINVANRLKESTRNTDVIARLGGDEFAVLLEARDHGEVQSIADRILSALKHPIAYNGIDLVVGASIGIADDASLSAAELMKAADAAMYAAKSSGGARAGKAEAA